MRNKKEEKVLPEIIKDPGLFYSYAKTFSSSKSEIGPLMDPDENLVSDCKQMADMLSLQYAAMFSVPSTNISREDMDDFFPPSLGACGPWRGEGGGPSEYPAKTG